jgi:trehalose/maltose hydrolase-like predicted phosphorylase
MFEEERHVTSDIAYCAWWYANASGDEAFLKCIGNELILEAARNVASRLLLDSKSGRYSFPGVIPPDEHSRDHYVGAPVNNSAMTNAYAKWLLETAATLGAEVASGERQQWTDMAERLQQQIASQNGVIPEYDGYDGHPIKQADVAHLYFPLHTTFDPAVLRKTVYYYADRERETGLYLTHSPSVYAAAFSKVGDIDGVGHFLGLHQCAFAGPYEVPRESNYGGPPVITGAGSFLSLLLFGVLGLNNFEESLSAHPCVPKQVGHISVSGICFGDRQYTIAAQGGTNPPTIKLCQS